MWNSPKTRYDCHSAFFLVQWLYGLEPLKKAPRIQSVAIIIKEYTMAARVYARYIATLILLMRKLARYIVQYQVEIKQFFPETYHQTIDDLLEILTALTVAADSVASDPMN